MIVVDECLLQKNLPNLLRISLICALRIFFSLPNGVRRSTFDAGLVTKFGAFSSLNFPKLI